ncbi:MAG TPA: type VI secretion system TssO [Parafilimonas sp.]|nr:type VI secretion system TssO [Parafilimonas sp.]
MKPLNQAARKNAFFRFLLFFIITVGVIVATVFFSIQVPFEENKKMKKDIADYQNQQKFMMQFSGKLTDLQTLIDTLQTPNIQTELIESKIKLAIGDLQAFKEKTMPGNDNIYARMIDALSKLESTNISLINLRSQSPDIGKLQTDMANLVQRINNANTYIMQLSSQVGIKPPYQTF